MRGTRLSGGFYACEGVDTRWEIRSALSWHPYGPSECQRHDLCLLRTASRNLKPPWLRQACRRDTHCCPYSKSFDGSLYISRFDRHALLTRGTVRRPHPSVWFQTTVLGRYGGDRGTGIGHPASRLHRRSTLCRLRYRPQLVSQRRAMSSLKL
jgi:hypothetical protein